MQAFGLTRLALTIACCLFLAIPAMAQYGGGGSMGSSSGTYTAPKGGYSSGTGIAIGAGAAAGVAVAYLALRNRNQVTGCVNESEGKTELLPDGGGKAFQLSASSLDLKPGERVRLRGKKSKTSSGARSFQAQKLVKNYGSCKQLAALHKP